MKVLIFSSLLVVALSASVLEELGTKFQAFKLEHGKIYSNQAEEAKRFYIFNDNVRVIEEHNALYEQGKVSYKKGINKFTDMTQEELKSMLALSASKKPTLETTPYVRTGLEVPPSVDWREKGQVTGVKDQGLFCGSCWAFSITGSTEGAYYRKSGKLVALSEQQLVDCCTESSGCAGGVLGDNFKYVMRDGLQSESSYPYKGADGDCAYSASNVVTKVSNFTSIEYLNEDALLDAVANVGPVSVGIDANYLFFYRNGIYDDPNCSTVELDHAVLVVGYGTENGKDFWIVKNSWGTWWGEKGYLRIARGKNACGIAGEAVFPIIN